MLVITNEHVTDVKLCNNSKKSWLFKVEFSTYENAKNYVKEVRSITDFYSFRIRTRGKWTEEKQKKFGKSRPVDLKIEQADKFVVYAFKK